MEHFVTLFDSLFLPQALALHASMQRHAGEYRLWMLCVDDAAHDTLTRLALPCTKPLRVTDLETPELRKARDERTRGEYCWTLTPFAPRIVFDADATAERVTYLDADFWFRRSPKPAFDEFAASGAGVLITDHAYAPAFDQSAIAGQYCVQFMVFNRHRGEPVRRWWADRCLEWCYARYEGGKFGDQKYLDDWPERFGAQVHVLRDRGLMLAPWNATRFPYSEAVAFHFHGHRLVEGGRVDFGSTYPLPRPLLEHVYEPYVDDLRAAVRTLRDVGVEIRPQAAVPGRLKQWRRSIATLKEIAWRFEVVRLRHL